LPFGAPLCVPTVRVSKRRPRTLPVLDDLVTPQNLLEHTTPASRSRFSVRAVPPFLNPLFSPYTFKMFLNHPLDTHKQRMNTPLTPAKLCSFHILPNERQWITYSGRDGPVSAQHTVSGALFTPLHEIRLGGSRWRCVCRSYYEHSSELLLTRQHPPPLKLG